ncbi:MAG: hypothetical protein ABSH20_03120 [Tepidisphaeraceae bacterium]|jgi:hypothetical protein
MIRQTLAIFVDAYRELSSRMIFWIVLLLAMLGLAGFALLGVSGQGVTIVGHTLFESTFIDPKIVYKSIYLGAMGKIWLVFGGTILAVVSVSSIFPDFISSGSVDLYIAKPISRLRLFLTKYLAGMAFIVAQLLIFSIGSFFVLGIRGGVWHASVFLALPIMLCFYSYLYAFSVLFGVVTRSTLAAVLLTTLMWAALYGVQKTEIETSATIIKYNLDIARTDATIKRNEAMLATLTRTPGAATRPTTSQGIIDNQQRSLDATISHRKDLQSSLHTWSVIHHLFYRASAILPKAISTYSLLDRYLISDVDFQAASNPPDSLPENYRDAVEAGKEVELRARKESLLWIIGTSLTFEFVVVSLAAWIFCQRDY